MAIERVIESRDFTEIQLIIRENAPGVVQVFVVAIVDIFVFVEMLHIRCRSEMLWHLEWAFVFQWCRPSFRFHNAEGPAL